MGHRVGRAARSAITLLLWVALCSIASGCARAKPKPDHYIETLAGVRSAIDKRLERARSARFKEVIFEYYGEERLKVRQLILVEAPDRLRVQTRLPGSDELLSVLVSDGSRFAVHRRDTNEYVTGRPTRANLNRLLPLDLSAADVVRLLLGGAPWDRLTSEPGELETSWDEERGRYLIETATQRGGRLQVRARPEDFAVDSMVELDARNQVLYRYTTDDWARHGGLWLPSWRRFEWEGEVDFSVDVKETQLNVDLPDSLFSLPAPPGSRVVELAPSESR